MSFSNVCVVDLETTFMRKGLKRGDTFILSIGAIDLYSSRVFHCFVKPTNIEDEEDLYDYFSRNGVRLEASKNTMKKIGYDFNTALPLTTASLLFKEFTENDPILIAHNGKSFDFPILEANFNLRLSTRFHLTFRGLDSYHNISKKIFFHLNSHKLSHVYSAVVKNKNKNIKWHTALDDSKALKQIVIEAAKRVAIKNAQEVFKELYMDINKMYEVNCIQDAPISNKTIKKFKSYLQQNEVHDIFMNKILKYAIKYFIFLK